MFPTNEEMVKKWGGEIAEKSQSSDPYVQYHTIVLLSDIKKKDSNSFKKYLFGLMKQETTGLATIQLLRTLKDLSKDMEYDSPEAKEFINFVNRNLRNRDDSVVFEAARVACECPLMANKDLMEVVKTL